MENSNFFRKITRSKIMFVLLIMISFIFSNCGEEAQLWAPKSQEQLAGDYIASNPDQFSEFEKLMKATGMESVLNVRGPYTVFLPDNDAMFAFYKLKNVNALEDFSDGFLKALILNHIVAYQIVTDDMGLGALTETNGLGDFVPTEFEGADIIIGKYSKIIKRDIRTANGYIHVIDRVFDPVTKDIYSIVSADPSYTIFAEGLKLSGLKDTLQIISFPYGKSTARTRFTVLAVPDSIYNRYEIYNVNDLIDWCNAAPDSLTYLNNPFYRYIEYHCLNGSFYLSDLNTGLYPILSKDNNLFVTMNDDYKINLDKKTNTYTGFIVPASNTPAKNGVLHAVYDVMPVIEPEPATVIFETTDFFDLKQGDYYLKYYQRFFDGQNTFAKIKWEGDYLLYYYKPIQDGIDKHDCLTILGWWSVSVTFPKVMKGKYRISIFQPGWNDVTNCIAYIDGVMTPYYYTGPMGHTGGAGGLQQIAEVDFTTTAEHTVTLKNNVYGSLYWDYIKFEPIR
jgi:uncharacterized surface protein with fasciclin (FAS1) repeats